MACLIGWARFWVDMERACGFFHAQTACLRQALGPQGEWSLCAAYTEEPCLELWRGRGGDDRSCKRMILGGSERRSADQSSPSVPARKLQSFGACYLRSAVCCVASEGLGNLLSLPSDRVRGCRLWREAAEYFPISVLGESSSSDTLYPADKSYLIGFHPQNESEGGGNATTKTAAPQRQQKTVYTHGGRVHTACLRMQHGVLSMSWLNIRLTTLSINMRLPFWGHLLQAVGFISCSRKSIKTFLSGGPGRAVLVVVGGAKEAFLGGPRLNDLVLHRRKGFFEIALQTGSWLIPVIVLPELAVVCLPLRFPPLSEFPFAISSSLSGSTCVLTKSSNASSASRHKRPLKTGLSNLFKSLRHLLPAQHLLGRRRRHTLRSSKYVGCVLQSPCAQVYSLGENDMYERLTEGMLSCFLTFISRKTMGLFGFSLPPCYGRGVLQVTMPRRVKIVELIGNPVPCRRIPHPTQEDIEELRQRYCAALQRVYTKARAIYGTESRIFETACGCKKRKLLYLMPRGCGGRARGVLDEEGAILRE
ncbi:hypothetical protein cyc_00924 [Cyclospora cayetanensis]|uniref:diacylglycerol O-acyltransferase n=1 Tax=Cyclospora cayetanensis TaxID=88456 RepID=A0A1D3D4Y2_9EIME|nr:hypothetical protein cyc_00924 [Cyclospora cayetanensis]